MNPYRAPATILPRRRGGWGATWWVRFVTAPIRRARARERESIRREFRRLESVRVAFENLERLEALGSSSELALARLRFVFAGLSRERYYRELETLLLRRARLRRR